MHSLMMTGDLGGGLASASTGYVTGQPLSLSDPQGSHLWKVTLLTSFSEGCDEYEDEMNEILHVARLPQ